MAVSHWSQKEILMGARTAAKVPKSSSKRAPGQELAQNGRFPLIPKGNFNGGPEGCQNAKIERRKGSRPEFGPL